MNRTPENDQLVWSIVHDALGCRPMESLNQAAERIIATRVGRVDLAEILCPREPPAVVWDRIYRAAGRIDSTR